MPEISKHKMVTLTYDLRIDDEKGEVIEQTTPESPLKFLYGAGRMLPRFEEHLQGLNEGEPFTIKLSKDDAYGDVNHEAIVELPKHIFLVDGKFDDELISEGNTVPMMSSNGQHLNGVVMEVNDDNVKMDFNHPLAGEDLFFVGKILEVRDASEDELAQAFSTGGCDCSGEDCGSEHQGGCGCGC
ncbi:MAG: FKBP-type peptidyl-prolyl cis-trans isomerase [Prolixibacteraceae bacterium]|nr:FKBP-type peptidyl-prolyl cis-trans isomerase [Prolixibacteraceae bacterium]